MNEWFEKRLPKPLYLNIQCKSQELNGALHKIESKSLTLTSHFGSQFALQFFTPPAHLILSFGMETLHFKGKLMLSDVCLTGAKRWPLWEVSRFNQAAEVKTCF